jgi:4-hydroxy-tetrahydrodipicolinate synthase
MMNTKKKYRGVIVPMVTPLTEAFKLDRAGVETIMANLYRHGAMPFILGTTGESTSLPNSLKLEYIKAAARAKASDTVLYAGISSNCLEESVDFARRCFDAGVDVVAATLPSYYTLSTSQMKRYFEQLADQMNGPLIIYNITATTHMSIPLEVIDDLSYHPNIVGTKDSERSTERLDRSLDLWANRPDFSHFLGWAAKSAYALINGSDGLVPSTGNLLPSIYQEMQKAVVVGDHDRAYSCQNQSDIFGHLYQDGRTLGESLWALKVLMQEYGLCQSHVMPPLQPLSTEEAMNLVASLEELVIKENV